MSFITNPAKNGLQVPFKQLAGPLAKLFNKEGSGNFVYPSDLTTNPAMSHAVQFSIYDWNTPFAETISNAPNTASAATQAAVGAYQEAITKFNETRSAYSKEGGSTPANLEELQAATTSLEAKLVSAAPALFSLFQSSYSATTYKPRKKSNILSKISLYLPDTLTASWDSNYNSVSMTQELGKLGFLASAADSIKSLSKNGISNITASDILSDPNAKSAISTLLGTLGGKLGGSAENQTQLLEQALGQFVNPQTQLIYQGRDFRNFTMTFIFTPKSSAEAESVQNIIDTFTYYSSPGLINAGSTDAGRYLTPPQLMSVKMVFTGQNGITGSVITQLKSALNNAGLGFLNSNHSLTDTISSGQKAKIFDIKECVITNVAVDYAPNGWAAFSDGYPVQTTMTLSMMETSIFTKADVKNSKVSKNYQDYQAALAKQAAEDQQQYLGGGYGA